MQFAFCYKVFRFRNGLMRIKPVTSMVPAITHSAPTKVLGPICSSKIKFPHTNAKKWNQKSNSQRRGWANVINQTKEQDICHCSTHNSECHHTKHHFVSWHFSGGNNKNKRQYHDTRRPHTAMGIIKSR